MNGRSRATDARPCAVPQGLAISLQLSAAAPVRDDQCDELGLTYVLCAKLNLKLQMLLSFPGCWFGGPSPSSLPNPIIHSLTVLNVDVVVTQYPSLVDCTGCGSMWLWLWT